MLVLGLMSGTSLDGIDAALCEIEGSGALDLRASLLAFECYPYPAPLRERLRSACENRVDTAEIARLHIEVGRLFADTANRIFERHCRAELIGSHGQTVCHLPGEGVSLQIGSAAHIAEGTGVPVVADFRLRDMAAGGQGAPLVPFADWVLLRSATVSRVVQNIGGIANCTVLPRGAEPQSVRAWDTGPGNLLLDEAARHFFGVSFDTDGQRAARGQADEACVESMLQHPFFDRRPPKTCGREEFGAAFFERWKDRLGTGEDALATLSLFTARSIARSLHRFFSTESFEFIVGGGGAYNSHLLRLLKAELPAATVKTHEAFGVRSDAREALAFAMLAHETWHGRAGNIPSATGAQRPVALGHITK